MKRFLCAILTMVCILALCSCNLLEKFMSFDGTETNMPTKQDPNNNESVPSDKENAEGEGPSETNQGANTPEDTIPNDNPQGGKDPVGTPEPSDKITEPDEEPTTPSTGTDIFDPELSVSPEEVTWVKTQEEDTDIILIMIDRNCDGKYVILGDFLVKGMGYDPNFLKKMTIKINNESATLESPVFAYDCITITLSSEGDKEDSKRVSPDRVRCMQLESSTSTQVDIGVIIDDGAEGEYINLLVFVYGVLFRQASLGDDPVDFYVNGVIAQENTRVYNNDVVSVVVAGEPCVKPENPVFPEKPEDPPVTNTITVQIIYQTGGVHRVESTITTTSPATLLDVYNLFANEHPYETFNNAECYLNDKPIDPTQTVYMQNGDMVYLQENSNGYHLHIWEMGLGYCRSCSEECTHEWKDSICCVCKSECYHTGQWNDDVWINGQCGECGALCMHEQWNDNRQCIVCGEFLGVDLLHIEIYEDDEYKYYTQVIEITVGDLVMSYYGFSWEHMANTYDFYYNDVLITDGTFVLTESGTLLHSTLNKSQSNKRFPKQLNF